MDGGSNFLPITVSAAIALFLVREVLEGWRRWRGNARKRIALRNLLARECELNLWALKCLHRAVRAAREALRTDPPQPFFIEIKRGGHDYWRHAYASGELRQGGSLPPARKTTMEGAALTLAELDRDLFKALEGALDAIAEMDHVRGTLIDLTETEDELMKGLFGSFTGYAFEEMHLIYAGLNGLYKECTGRRLATAKIR